MKTNIRPSFVGMIALILCGAASAQIPDTAWTRTFEGDGIGHCVQQTADGGYVITGYKYFPTSANDIFVMKTDAYGDSIWAYIYGDMGDDEAYYIQQTNDGGFIITGKRTVTNQEDLWLLKTDPLGDTLWTKTYGGSYDEQGFSVQQTPDGGYIVGGGTSSFGAGPPGTYDVWLLRTDTLGDTLWTRTYCDPGLQDGHGLVKNTTDGGYIIACHGGGWGNLDLWLIKTDSLGDTLWWKTYGGYDWDIHGWDFQITSDGGCILAAYTWSFGPGTPNYSNIWLLRTDSSGDTLWARVYGGTNNDSPGCVDTTADGGYVIAGLTKSYGSGGEDLWLIKTDSTGDSLGTRTYGTTYNDWGQFIRITSDHGYIITGGYNSPATWHPDIWLLKTQPDLGIAEHEPSSEVKAMSLQVSPNPFYYTTKIRYSLLDTRYSMRNPAISIYDATGRLVRSFNLESSIQNLESEVMWDGTDQAGRKLASGVYFVKLTDGDKSIVEEKVILIR